MTEFTRSSKSSIAVVGTGPAGLMAADQLASRGFAVTLFEKRKAPGWKLFIAGSSGLNITNNLPLEAFREHYRGKADVWERVLAEFPPSAWIQFIEKELGLGTFLGTSGRYFVETMHAAKLLRHWRKRLEQRGVELAMGHSLAEISHETNSMIRLTWADGSMRSFHACVLALGGGSYASEDEPVLWPELLTSHSISCIPFEASNTGYTVPWKAAFLQEAEGKPLKNICLSNARGSRRGDLVVTEYGLEGTPIYFLGEPGPCLLDLKPDLSLLDVLARLQKGKENLSPIRRVQKFMNLCEASQSLLFHHAPDAARSDLTAMASVMKQFPLTLSVPRPLRESISSSGGVAWEELDERFMLRRLPNVYCIGEMIDWDAPTGGFLIQGCVSQGYSLAHHLPLPLESDPPSP